MKRLTLYLLGILTMILMCTALFLSSAIYDAWNKSQTEIYFFRPDNSSKERPGKPVSPSELGDSAMRDMLIQKFVTEYFYVWPNVANVENRAQRYGALFWLSSSDILAQWVAEMAPEIQQMSNNHMFRTVTVDSIFRPLQSDYLSVGYELKTWTTPNNPSAMPEIEHGRLLLKISFRQGMPQSVLRQGIHNILDAGGDPVTLFQFEVTDIIIQE